MKKNLLSQLAVAGIAAGMIAVSVNAEKATPATANTTVSDSAKPMKKSKAKMKMAKPDSTHAMAPMHDSAMTAPATPAAAAATGKHACKGHNSCKGMGGCHMTDADIDAAAKKMGKAREKAGKAHSCGGKNECKGLGGCKAS